MSGIINPGGGGGGTPGGSPTQVQFNNAGAFGGIAGSSVDVNGSVGLGSGTINTASDPVLNLAQTWNNATIATTGASGTGTVATITFAAQAIPFSIGESIVVAGITPAGYNGTFTVTASTTTSVSYSNTTTGAQTVAGTVQANSPFTAIKLNVTNTASVTGSLLQDWQVGGTSSVNLDVNGRMTWVGFGLIKGDPVQGTGFTFRNIGDTLATSITFGTGFSASGIQYGGNATIAATASKVLLFGDASFANTNGWFNYQGQSRVTADFSVTSSVVLTNVTGLTVNVQAGRTYKFTAEISWTDAAAGGIQAAISGTATATNIIYDGWIVDSAANGIKGNAQATALGTAVASAVTTGTAGHLTIEGTITVNAAGTLTVQIAQNTSNATATVAKRGSTFIVQDMP